MDFYPDYIDEDYDTGEVTCAHADHTHVCDDCIEKHEEVIIGIHGYYVWVPEPDWRAATARHLARK